MEKKKFYFSCSKCKHEISNFSEWFASNQKCPKCGSNRVHTIYTADNNKLVDLIKSNEKPESLWYYFDFLPLNNTENITTRGEGILPIDRWEFLENYAKEKYNIDCEVLAYRNDLSHATGTFKDKGAAMAASVLKEEGMDQYVVVSTGNTATAFSHYMAAAGISVSVFIPQDALMQNETEIGSYGQRVFRVLGDYSKAKEIAAQFAQKYNIQITGGNFDPLRVEAKKTMVFEWLRKLGKMPEVYIQALSGGTGPFAIEKAYHDLEGTGLVDKLPRFILVQPDRCAPMTHAWEKAKANNFPKGYETDYPIYENPETAIPTLATGHPKTYPAMAPLVRKSEGEIISFAEDLSFEVARLIGYETTIRVGPASTIAIGGFFEALKKGLIKNGDSVMINMGEGVSRAIDLMNQMNYTTKEVSSIDECKPFDRAEYKSLVWKPFMNY